MIWSLNLAMMNIILLSNFSNSVVFRVSSFSIYHVEKINISTISLFDGNYRRSSCQVNSKNTRLTHLRPMLHFFTPSKHQKIKAFLIFLGGMGMRDWPGVYSRVPFKFKSKDNKKEFK